MNLAARLQDQAAGETLISAAVQRGIGGRVRAEPLGPRALRGFDRPVPVWLVVGVDSSAGDAARTPFVGRARERTQIAGILDVCLESRRGGVVLVRGEAGIGKTRLVEEIGTLAGALGMARHRALVLDFGVGKGRDPIPALVRGLLDVAPDGSKSEWEGRAAAAVDGGIIDQDQVPFLHDLLDLPQPADQRARFDAMDSAARRRGIKATVATLAARLAEGTPRLLIVEDLHWADASALEHLAELAAAAGEAPMVLVMTTCVEGDPVDHGWRGATRGSPVTTIDLAPLRTAISSAASIWRSNMVSDASSRATGSCSGWVLSSGATSTRPCGKWTPASTFPAPCTTSTAK